MTIQPINRIDPNGIYTTGDVERMFHCSWENVRQKLELKNRIFSHLVLGTELLEAISNAQINRQKPQETARDITASPDRKKPTPPSQIRFLR